jgi:hypothetical protein
MLAEPNTVVQVETVQVKRLDDVIGEVRATSLAHVVPYSSSRMASTCPVSSR